MQISTLEDCYTTCLSQAMDDCAGFGFCNGDECWIHTSTTNAGGGYSHIGSHLHVVSHSFKLHPSIVIENISTVFKIEKDNINL